MVVEFIKSQYFLIFYGITWFFSIIYYRKYFDTVLKYFPIFISYTFLSELLGYLIYRFEDFQLVYNPQFSLSRSIVYNVYYLLFFGYFIKIYQSLFEELKHKRLAQLMFWGLIVVTIINSFFKNPLIFTLVQAFLYGAISLSILIILHLNIIYKRSDFVYFNLMFWVGLGLIAFHLPYIPIKIIKEYYNHLYASFYQIHLMLIVLMYILFCIGFIKSSRRAFR